MMTNKLLTITLGGVLLLAATAAPPQQPAPSDSMANSMVFDVRNGDQTGKLVLRETDMGFESLSDARHSRKWKYAELREISKKRKELSIKPFQGSKYAFQFGDNAMRDRLYKLISDRILAARQGK